MRDSDMFSMESDMFPEIDVVFRITNQTRDQICRSLSSVARNLKYRYLNWTIDSEDQETVEFAREYLLKNHGIDSQKYRKSCNPAIFIPVNLVLSRQMNPCMFISVSRQNPNIRNIVLRSKSVKTKYYDSSMVFSRFIGDIGEDQAYFATNRNVGVQEPVDLCIQILQSNPDFIFEEYVVVDQISEEDKTAETNDVEIEICEQKTPDPIELSIDDIKTHSLVISIDKERYQLFYRNFQNYLGFVPKIMYGSIDKNLTPERNCLKSHMMCVQKAKDENWPFVCIFEDDAYPCDDILKKICEQTRDIPGDAECLLLGWCNYQRFRQKFDMKFNVVNSIISGAHAYIIFKSGYDSYFEFFRKNPNKPADNDIFAYLKSYVLKEPLFIQYNEKKSMHGHNGFTKKFSSVFVPKGFSKLERNNIYENSNFTHINDKQIGKVSIIVPVFNSKDYIGKCLSSLLNQTYKNIEIICVDDGSTDGSFNLLKTIQSTNSNIKLIHTINYGPHHARNIGIDNSNGEFIMFVDSDDFIDKDTVQTCINNIENNDIVLFDIKYFDNTTGKSLPYRWYISRNINSIQTEVSINPENLKTWNIGVSACTQFYRREFIVKNKIQFENVFSEDSIWTFDCLMNSKSIKILNKKLYFYRKNIKTSRTNSKTQKQISDFIKFLINRGYVYQKKFSYRRNCLFLNRILFKFINYGKDPIVFKTIMDNFHMLKFNDVIDDIDKDNMDSFKQMIEKSTISPYKKSEIFRSLIYHDSIIISGQFNSLFGEQRDACVLFEKMFDMGLNVFFMIQRKHENYLKYKNTKYFSNVLPIDGNGYDQEFIVKYWKYFASAKAVIQETASFDTKLRIWLKNLPGCKYIFLQHGYSMLKPAIGNLTSCYNKINVNSVEEMKFIKSVSKTRLTDDNFIIAGLPRLDILHDESKNQKKKTILLMLTWRMSFKNKDAFCNSQYYMNLKQFLNKISNSDILDDNTDLVIIPHHALANSIGTSNINIQDFTFQDSKNVSYWVQNSSMLITDYSSVSFDFMFLNKPVLFWQLDRYDANLNSADKMEIEFTVKQQIKNNFTISFNTDQLIQNIKSIKKNEFISNVDYNYLFPNKGKHIDKLIESIG